MALANTPHRVPQIRAESPNCSLEVDGGAGSRTGLRRYGELSNDRYIIATPILFGLHHHYARI
jgi:hypothetical protein